MAGSMALRVCQLCAVDFSMKRFLLPLIDEMNQVGWEVTGVCSDGAFVPGMRSDGYKIVTIPIARSLNPLLAIRTLILLLIFFRRNRFDVVHTHTPVASIVGRAAARLAGIPIALYTAHGFYFHDGMSFFKQKFFVFLERVAGRITDFLFTQSGEDADAAVSLGIVPRNKVMAIGNGVDVARFDPVRVDGRHVRSALGIPTDAEVIGIVARLVEEKGYREFLSAAATIAARRPNVYFLVIGERLASDHASGIEQSLNRARNTIGKRLVLAGMREDIPEMLSAMDIFCLPSHREGMPRTIIEAMMMARPVVATNIRGSREEVVDGTTGLLVPTHDPVALGEALLTLLESPERAREMGRLGRERALTLFDERAVIRRQLDQIRVLCRSLQTPERRS